MTRDESFEALPSGAIAVIRDFSIAIIRSGSTFSSFEIATRAVAAWRLSIQEFRRVNYEWQHECTPKRLNAREKRAEEAAQIKKPDSRLPAPRGASGREFRYCGINPDYGLLDADANTDIQGFGDLYRDFEEMRRLDDGDVDKDPEFE